ncbi:allatotropins-like [Contarinia nasturtii]|uniref:allatotropins-like n=1 Tax=Contarinia nasturtii TaxID=265458 RepID=UPI0012D41B65|nr:allatotropins-like [Contarinia nasturtii]XP_031640415.1 allatotropins-like [Contarinia nasturtii]
MSNCRVLCVLTVVIALLGIGTSVYGGPARSMAARTMAKIPRAIRAPYRNNEIMTARGFGKRSQMTKINDDIPWSMDKFDAQDSSSDNDDSIPKLLNSQFEESYPIELIVQETLGNPAFLRSILNRYVDTNHDGQISLREYIDVASPVANGLI